MLQLKLPEVQTKKTEVIKKHIAAEAKKDPTAMAQVVRTWLNGEIPAVTNDEKVPGLRKAAILMVMIGDEASSTILQEPG